MFNKQPNNGKPTTIGPEPAPTPSSSGGHGHALASIAAAEAPSRKAPVSKIASLLAGDLVIEGNVFSEGELHIDGVIRGDVKAPRLSVGETGSIEGAVHADAVEVRGRVHGSITAKQVRLLSTSNVEGDVTHEQLTMETGAHFQGRSLKFERPAPTPVVAPAPTPAPAAAKADAKTEGKSEAKAEVVNLAAAQHS